MLQPLIAQFLEYRELANFSARSIQAMEIRLREFRFFALGHKLRAVADITYLHFAEFTAQYRQPSIHIRKSRVWALRQFFHFPALHGHFCLIQRPHSKKMFSIYRNRACPTNGSDCGSLRSHNPTLFIMSNLPLFCCYFGSSTIICRIQLPKNDTNKHKTLSL